MKIQSSHSSLGLIFISQTFSRNACTSNEQNAKIKSNIEFQSLEMRFLEKNTKKIYYLSNFRVTLK